MRWNPRPPAARLSLAAAALLAVGCVIPDGEATPSECTWDTLGATFSLSAAEVSSYGGTLSQSECEAECEAGPMQAYPESDPSLCELQSSEEDGSQTWYCEWEGIVSCP